MCVFLFLGSSMPPSGHVWSCLGAPWSVAWCWWFGVAGGDLSPRVDRSVGRSPGGGRATDAHFPAGTGEGEGRWACYRVLRRLGCRWSPPYSPLFVHVCRFDAFPCSSPAVRPAGHFLFFFFFLFTMPSGCIYLQLSCAAVTLLAAPACGTYLLVLRKLQALVGGKAGRRRHSNLPTFSHTCNNHEGFQVSARKITS